MSTSLSLPSAFLCQRNLMLSSLFLCVSHCLLFLLYATLPCLRAQPFPTHACAPSQPVKYLVCFASPQSSLLCYHMIHSYCPHLPMPLFWPLHSLPWECFLMSTLQQYQNLLLPLMHPPPSCMHLLNASQLSSTFIPLSTSFPMLITPMAHPELGC